MSKSSKDPIFAAIEKYRALYAEAENVDNAISGYCDRNNRRADGSHPELRKLERRRARLGDAEFRAVQKLCRTKPTTLAGVVAAMRFVEKREAKGDNLLDLLSEDRRTHRPVFFATMRRALERLAA